jgi:hypothetical protein
MLCEWRNGLPNGFGYFTTKDNSYDFEGEFVDGKPVRESTGHSLWTSLDRSELEAADKDKKKDAKKPKDKKGKSTIESLATVQRGQCLGKSEIRSALCSPPPVVVVAEVVPAKKDKTAPVVDDGKTKEPPLLQSVAERRNNN